MIQISSTTPNHDRKESVHWLSVLVILPPGCRLFEAPGARTRSAELGVHKKTWLESLGFGVDDENSQYVYVYIYAGSDSDVRVYVYMLMYITYIYINKVDLIYNYVYIYTHTYKYIYINP